MSNAHRCRKRKEGNRQGKIVASVKAFQPVVDRTVVGKLQKELVGLGCSMPPRLCVATMQYHHRFADQITKCLTEPGFLLHKSIQKRDGNR